MTKDEFKAKRRELVDQSVEIHEKICQHNQDYINANKPCNIGDVVEVQNGGKTERGVVVDFSISYVTDEIEPVLKKLKKDGTASSHNLRVWHNDKIIYPELKPIPHETHHHPHPISPQHPCRDNSLHQSIQC